MQRMRKIGELERKRGTGLRLIASGGAVMGMKGRSCVGEEEEEEEGEAEVAVCRYY